MSKGIFLAFSLTAGAVLVGVDYYVQAQAAGVDISRFGFTGYEQSVRARIGTMQLGAGTEEAELVSFLPEPKGAWTRAPWSKQRGKQIVEEIVRLQELGDPKDPVRRAAEKQYARMWTYNPLGDKRRHTLVYHRDDEVIEVTIKRKENASGLVTAVAEQVANEGHRNVPFGRFRGVEYIESHGWAEGTESGIGTSSFRSISGHIGDEVVIALRADAKQQSIRWILASIDYDGVKSVLSEQYSEIGNRRASSLPQVTSPSSKTNTTIKRIRVKPAAAAREEPGPWEKVKRFFGMAS